jgi:hypothetical protein
MLADAAETGEEFSSTVATPVRIPEGEKRGGYGVFTEGFKRARELLEGE